jgi:hypothetical protein
MKKHTAVKRFSCFRGPYDGLVIQRIPDDVAALKIGIFRSENGVLAEYFSEADYQLDNSLVEMNDRGFSNIGFAIYRRVGEGKKLWFDGYNLTEEAFKIRKRRKR